MAFIGNLLWFIFGFGWFWWLYWALGSVILCITIVGIPFGVAGFRIANYAALPFGRDLVDKRILGEERVTGTLFGNILWILLVGLWLSISHVLNGIACCLTIIGIPFGIAHFKLARISFAPLGKKSLPTDVAKLAKHKFAENQLDNISQCAMQQIKKENKAIFLGATTATVLFIGVAGYFLQNALYKKPLNDIHPSCIREHVYDFRESKGEQKMESDPWYYWGIFDAGKTNSLLNNLALYCERRNGNSLDEPSVFELGTDGRIKKILRAKEGKLSTDEHGIIQLELTDTQIIFHDDSGEKTSINAQHYSVRIDLKPQDLEHRKHMILVNPKVEHESKLQWSLPKKNSNKHIDFTENPPIG